MACARHGIAWAALVGRIRTPSSERLHGKPASTTMSAVIHVPLSFYDNRRCAAKSKKEREEHHVKTCTCSV